MMMMSLVAVVAGGLMSCHLVLYVRGQRLLSIVVGLIVAGLHCEVLDYLLLALL